MPYIVLDPTDEPIKTSFSLAPRPEKLKGKILGVIDNGKKNSDYLLKRILERLQAEEETAGHVYVRKPSVSRRHPGRSGHYSGRAMRRGHCRDRGLRLLQFGQCARRHHHGEAGQTHGGDLHRTLPVLRQGHGPGPRVSGLSVCVDPPSHQRHRECAAGPMGGGLSG